MINQKITPSEKTENTDGFPSDFEHPNLKNTEEWIKRWAKAFWSSARNQTGAYTFSNDKARFVNNRDYSEGQYPVEDFENLGFDFGGDESDTTYLNIDRSVETPLPTVISRITGMLYNNPFEVNVKPLDPESLMEADVELNKIKFRIATKEIREKIEREASRAKMAASGTELEGDIQDKIPDPEISVPEDELPEDLDEFRIFRHTQYKPARAAASESILKYFRDKTNDERIKIKNARDLVDLKIAGRRVWLDPETYEVKQREIDPVNLVMTWCKQDDFSDAKGIGEIIYPTIDEIRMTCPEIPESELFQIAKSAAGNRNNRNWMYASSTSFGDATVNYNDYKDFTISVLDAEFKSVDVYEKRKKQAKNGGFYYQTLDHKFKKPKSPKSPEKYIQKKISSIYKFKYILDTDYIYDYGRKENTVRKKQNGVYEDPCFGFILYAPNMRDMRNKAITERAIPHVKQLVLIQLKIQQHIANATPSGHAWDIDAVADALNGMGLDGKRPIDIIKMRKSIGDTFIKGRAEGGLPNSGNQPVYELPSSLNDGTLDRLGAAYNNELTRLYETLGINNAAGRAAPDKDMLNAQEEMALMATQDSFRELQKAFYDIEQRTNEIAMLYYQKIIKHLPQKAKQLKLAIGDENINIFDVSKLTNCELGITINMLPNGAQLQIFQKYLAREVEIDAISSTDALAIENFALNNGIQKAEMVMKHRKESYAKQKEKAKEAESQRQIQLRQAEQQAIAQAEQAKAQAQAQSKIAIDQNEYKLKNDFAIEEYERKKEYLAVEKDFDKELIRTQNEEAQKFNDAIQHKSSEGSAAGIPRPAPKAPDMKPSTRVDI